MLQKYCDQKLRPRPALVGVLYRGKTPPGGPRNADFVQAFFLKIIQILSNIPFLRYSWVGLGWTGLDWVGLGWTGLDWVGLGGGAPALCHRHDFGRFPLFVHRRGDHVRTSFALNRMWVSDIEIIFFLDRRYCPFAVLNSRNSGPSKIIIANKFIGRAPSGSSAGVKIIL